MLSLLLCFVWLQTSYAEKGEMQGDVEYFMMYDNETEPLEFRNSGGGRPGSATNTHSCGSIRGVPGDVRQQLRLSNFYQRYTEAYGIPILSSARVPVAAMQRACYVARFLFADLYSIRNSYYKRFGRMAVMAQSEGTTTIPEFSHMPKWWDQRARGLGGTPHNPICSCAEENALCYGNDRYRDQDIVLHEFSHGFHLVGANFGVRDFNNRLNAAFNNARARGLWRNTYAISIATEYWGEGVISYFNDNGEANPPNGVKNHVNTNAELRSYDPMLYNLIASVFPCRNQFINRCRDTNQAQSLSARLKLNYPECRVEGGGGGGAMQTSGGCVDSNNQCPQWATLGECQKNPAYMSKTCRKSCRVC